MLTEPSVAIVLVNWHGWPECIECIDSLLLQSHRNFQVLVVDNGFSDHSLEHIAGWCRSPKADPSWTRHHGVRRYTDRAYSGPIPYRVAAPAEGGLSPAPNRCSLTLIPSGENLGYAGGCNVGIEAAGIDQFDYFWFLNPDTVAHQSALTELINRAQRAPRIGIVGSTLRYYDRPEVLQAMGGARFNRSNGTSAHIGQGAQLAELPLDGAIIEREMDYVVGASMLVSAEFITEVGLMAEDYFLYFEEIDWAFRRGAKFTLGFAPKSHVFHKSGANSSKKMPSFSSKFYYRNRLRFIAKFLPDQLGSAKWSLVDNFLRHVARGRWAQARIVLNTLLTARKIVANVTRA